MGVWQVDGHPVRIEYTPLVMEELRRAAEEGFQRISHGGLEVGGLLFGGRHEDTVTVADWRPLECEHAKGPGFVLSSNDEAGLRKLLEEAAGDADLKDLEPVGWWHSHTRSGIFLSPEDLELHNRYFPEPWQIALVLHPAKERPMAAGFFFRAADGDLHTAGSLREFILEPNPALPARPRRSARRRAIASEEPAVPLAPQKADWPRREGGLSASVAPADRLPPLSSPVWAQPAPGPEFRWRRWLAVAALSAAAATTAVLTRGLWLPVVQAALPQAGTSPALALRVSDSEGQMLIDWNRAAGVLRGASEGLLTIRDGGQERRIRLEAAELGRGSVTYARESEDVEVRLAVMVQGRTVAQEIARFLGPPPKDTPAGNLAGAQQRRDQMSAEAKTLRDQLRKEAARTQQLQQSIRLLENRMGAAEKSENRPR